MSIFNRFVKADRPDRGGAAVLANHWIHWQDSPDVYFGPDGLLCGDDYMPWIASGTYLVTACVAEQPARLAFSFNVFNGRSTERVDKYVAIPSGAGGDLELLQHHLYILCPKATIRLTQEPPRIREETPAMTNPYRRQ